MNMISEIKRGSALSKVCILSNGKREVSLTTLKRMEKEQGCVGIAGV